jgi:hypothetical protein
LDLFGLVYQFGTDIGFGLCCTLLSTLAAWQGQRRRSAGPKRTHVLCHCAAGIARPDLDMLAGGPTQPHTNAFANLQKTHFSQPVPSLFHVCLTRECLGKSIESFR